jgi:NADPH:quinone reductase-like Zn-dependent oxidoreductase
MMKAIVSTEYGPPEVLRLAEQPKPAPQDNQLLIKVYAASVNYGDLAARNFKAIAPSEFNMPLLFWLLAKVAFGLRQPRTTILGSEFAGKVEAVGAKVQSFQPGDDVFGYLGQTMGAYAEYVCLPENGCVALKPVNVDYAEAAVIPYGAIMAYNLLQKANIQPGQKVLVNGASGGIGSAAVQIAKHLGAEVTAVCGAEGATFAQALGADKVIDYSQEDFTQGDARYDLIFDVLGKSSFARSKKVLKPDGIHLYASFKTKQLWQMAWQAIVGGQRVICALAPGGREDLLAVKGLIEAGKIKGIVDKRFPLAETAAAHRYVESGGKKGPVAIIMEIYE